MKKALLVLAIAGLIMTGVCAYAAEETVLFGFENGLEGWEIPDWAYEKPDHVQKSLEQSTSVASEGEKLLTVVNRSA